MDGKCENCLKMRTLRSALPDPNKKLGKDMLEKAKVQLNETDHNRQKAVDKLRTMVKNEPNLKPRLDNAFLLKYLRAQKFNVHLAHKRICNYYRAKRDHSDIWNLNSFDSALKMLQSRFISILPHRDKDGAVVMYMKMGNWDVNEISATEMFTGTTTLMEWVLLDPETQICGIKSLVDAAGFSNRHMNEIRPDLIVFSTMLTLNGAVPVLHKSNNIIHSTTAFDITHHLYGALLCRELQSMMHGHGSNFASLHKEISQDILPPEYGGMGPPVTNDQTIKMFLEYRAEYNYNNTFGFIDSGSGPHY